MGISIIEKKDDQIILGFSGRIDTSNSTETENETEKILSEGNYNNVTIDMDELEYISSSGLRVLLKIAKKYKLKLTNVSADVYEVMDTVGFDQIMTIEKKLRFVSTKGLKELGKGSTGAVYQLDEDRVIKALYPFESLDYVKYEREKSHKVFMLGLPVAVVFDIVKTDDNYGIIYEMFAGNSLANMIEDDGPNMDKYVKITVDLLKEINSVRVEGDDLDCCKNFWMPYIGKLDAYVSDNQFKQIMDMMDAIPDDDHFVHGDFHPGNIMLNGDKPMLIDFSSASKGHYIYDLAAICTWSKILAYALGDAGARAVTGVGAQRLIAFWDAVIKEFCKDRPEDMKMLDDWCTAFGAIRVYSAITTPGMFPEEGLNWCKDTAFAILDKGLGQL